MPWSCPSCDTEVPDSSSTCPGCSAAKSTWSLQPEHTRNFVISRAKFELLRGEEPAPSARGEPLYDPYGLVAPEVARVLPKSAALRLFQSGRQPASRDLLIVRLIPKERLKVKLLVDFAVEDPHQQSFPVPGAPFVDIPFLFVYGSESLPAEFGFVGVHVVDLSEDTEEGLAPDLEFTAMKRPPVELPTEAVADDAPPVRHAALCVPGGLFAFDSAFPPPGVFEALNALKVELELRPEQRLGVFGHTDAAGSADYNKGLSDRRAQAIFALLSGDLAGFDALAEAEEWGVLHEKAMLRALGCNPSEIITLKGPNTERAVTAFQEAYNAGEFHRAPQSPAPRAQLEVDGDLGPNTAAALREAYLVRHSLFLPPERFLGPRVSGCSEFNPRGGSDAEDRRVSVVCYGDDAPPPEAFPCRTGDASVCPVGGEGCSFYRETVEEAESLEELRPFRDFRWLKGSAGKGRVHLSALTTLPDEDPCSFRVYRLEGEPTQPPPCSFHDDDEPQLGELLATLDGTIKLGVAFVKWTPESGVNPFDESGPRYVFRVDSGSHWAVSYPPERQVHLQLHTEDIYGYTVPEVALELRLLPEWGNEDSIFVTSDAHGYLELDAPEGVFQVFESDGTAARRHAEDFELLFEEALVRTELPRESVARIVVRTHDGELEEEYAAFLELYQRRPGLFAPGPDPVFTPDFPEFVDHG